MSVPPRSSTDAISPSPLTNMGTLSDYGLLSDPEPITDVSPDFGWMSSMEIFRGSFTFSKDSTMFKTLISILPYFKSHYFNSLPTNEHVMAQATDMIPDWHFLPFLSSRWWSGKVRIRLMAIKPEQVTGKLLISWTPDIYADYEQSTTRSDTLRRSIKYEWDLGTSNEYSLEIVGYNVTRLRPTWLHWVPYSDKKEDPPSCGIMPPLMMYTSGILNIEPIQSLQPGSLFPDSIRILFFHSFHDTSFHTSTDVRGTAFHFFGVRGPPDWNLNHE